MRNTQGLSAMAFSKSTGEFYHVKFYHLQTRQTSSIEKGTSDEKQRGWSTGSPARSGFLLLPHSLEAVAAPHQGSSIPNAALGAESAGLYARPFSLPTSEHFEHICSLNKQESVPSVCKWLCYLKALQWSRGACCSLLC